jgi:hypothetical protein
MRHRRLVALAVLALGGCAHEQPFQPQDSTTDRPFSPGTPVRLTYNPGADLRPAWLPDGSAFVYAWQQLGQPDLDRCLGIMGAAGGTRTTTICNPNPAAVDSADLFDAASPSPAGDLLYVRTSSRPGAIPPDHGGVFLAPLADPLNATEVLTLPSPSPSGRTLGFISTARWRSAKRLLYVGQSVVYSREYNGAPLDTLVTGVEIVEMDLTGAQPLVSTLPLTDGASSAALTETRDTLYYTLNNDSRVYRLVLTSAELTIAHDFGARGIARDVTVRGGNLVAVVGGEIRYSADSIIGPVQADGGGDLVSVDLATGAESDLPVDHPLLFRHPEFSPGSGPIRLVAEGYAPTGNPSPTRNQLVSKVGDLYLYESP